MGNLRLLHSSYTAKARARNGLEHKLIVNIVKMKPDEESHKYWSLSNVLFQGMKSYVIPRLSNAVEKFDVSSTRESERTILSTRFMLVITTIKSCITEQLSCLDSRTVKMVDYFCKSHEINEVFNHLNNCLHDLDLYLKWNQGVRI